jgi:hypothetical protein
VENYLTVVEAIRKHPEPELFKYEAGALTPNSDTNARFAIFFAGFKFQSVDVSETYY